MARLPVWARGRQPRLDQRALLVLGEITAALCLDASCASGWLPRRHIGVTCGGSRTPTVGRCSHERRLISFDGALTMKPSPALSGDVNVSNGSGRAYLAGEHGF